MAWIRIISIVFVLNQTMLDVGIKRTGLEVLDDTGRRLDWVVGTAQINKPVGSIGPGVKEAEGADGRFYAAKISPFGIHMGVHHLNIFGAVAYEIWIFSKIVVAGNRGMVKHAVELPDQPRRLLQRVERVDQQDEADWRIHNRWLKTFVAVKERFMIF
jgi:hypothetical protein